MFDLIVIGAGPAGIVAATTGDALGLRVQLLDEQSAPGGQIYRDVDRAHRQRASDATLLGPDYTRGLSLVEQLKKSRVDYVPQARVWHVDAAQRLVYFSAAGKVEAVQGRALVLAHGAMERPLPVVDWTLPGVMGAGAAQVLLKSAGVVPQGPVVLAGNGPLQLLVAAQLRKAGAEVALVAEATQWRDYLRAAGLLSEALRVPSYLAKGMQLYWDLARSGIRTRRGLLAISATGGERLENVTLRFCDRQIEIRAQTLLIHGGVVPNTQISRLLGLKHEFDAVQQCFRPVTDRYGASSHADIFIVGDGAGILGARAAELSGRVAALRIATRWGRMSIDELHRLTESPLRALDAERAVRSFLDALFPAPRFAIPEEPSALVCRCHEITVRQIMLAAEAGSETVDELKGLTRCGMGPCQGRMCSPIVAALLATARNLAAGEMYLQRVRPPLQPLTLGELASL